MTSVGTLETAAALEAEGRHADAIDVLDAEVRRHPTPEVEVALTSLRHRSWSHLTSDSAPRPVVTEVPPPPIGSSGLPEATLDEVDASTLHAAIHHGGCLLVRNAIEPDRVDQLRAAIDASFDACDRPPDERDDPGVYTALTLDAETAKTLGASRLAIPRRFARDAGGVLIADTPRAMSMLLSTYEDLGLHRVVSDYLGDRPVMSALKCTLRRVGVDEVGGWHQDGAFLGSGIGAVNIWLTLTPCGIDAPGLDILPQRFDEVVETGTNGAYFDWAVGEHLIDRIAGPAGVVRPTFEAGDILLFDEMLLHRTAVDAAMTTSRYAIEFWCFAASAYPDTHVPLVW